MTLLSTVYDRNITCRILQCSSVHFNMNLAVEAGNIFEQTMTCWVIKVRDKFQSSLEIFKSHTFLNNRISWNVKCCHLSSILSLWTRYLMTYIVSFFLSFFLSFLTVNNVFQFSRLLYNARAFARYFTVIAKDNFGQSVVWIWHYMDRASWYICVLRTNQMHFLFPINVLCMFRIY